MHHSRALHGSGRMNGQRAILRDGLSTVSSALASIMTYSLPTLTADQGAG